MRDRGYTKLLARHHTGKIREHKHTSYGSLLLLLLLAVVPLVIASQTVAIAEGEGQTEGGGQYSTYAVVAGPVPGAAPIITSPVSGRTVTSSEPVPVRGSCPGNTLVKVFINDILAGTDLCRNGSFAISVAPFVGTNSIVARAYNTNDAPSPDSAVVVLQLALPGVPVGSGAGAATNSQFFITSEQSYRGYEVGRPLTWPLIVSGGQAPYAVSIDWGDGKSDLISQPTPGRFTVSHTYKKPNGNNRGYQVTIHASDKAGNTSYLELVAIVSGDPAAAGVVSNVRSGYHGSTAIKVAWQGIAVATLVVLSFWLGELRKLHQLRHLGGTA